MPRTWAIFLESPECTPAPSPCGIFSHQELWWTKCLLKDVLLMWTPVSLSEGLCPFDDGSNCFPDHN